MSRRGIMKYGFTAEGEGELTVPEGSEITLLEPDNGSGWLLVQTKDNRRGFIPADFVEFTATTTSATNGTTSAATTTNDFKQHAASRMSVALSPAAAAAAAAAVSTGGGGGGGFISTTDLSMWSSRDSIFTFDKSPRTPIAPSRRWYYRDVFGDVQGPFNSEEMNQRIEGNLITSENTVLLEMGTGASQAYEEKPLRAFFGSAKLFSGPVIIDQNSGWYYLDGAKQEQGPFCDAQMREWLDDGYFGATTLVRDAASSPSSSSYASLSTVFRDPTLAFLRERRSSTNTAPNPSSSSWMFDPSALSSLTTGNSSKPPIRPQNSTVGMFDPFSSNSPTAGSSPFGSGSGRDLLRAAIGAGDLSGNGTTGGGGRSAAAMTMEDTLDLFDQVGLDDGTGGADTTKDMTSDGKPSTSKPKKPSVPIRVYGNTTQWPEFKGIPSYKDNPQQYPTTIYTFFTRPLNPAAGRVLCYIRREIDGMSALSYNKYTLFLEQGDIPLAVATRHSGPMYTTFEIKLLTSPHEGSARNTLTAAKMEVNFLGTQFLLHNSVQGHQGKPRDLAVIMYERNRGSTSKGPRKMKVGIPDVESGKPEFKTFMHGATGSNNMLTALQAINVQDLIPLLNKPPKWNPAKKSFSLDFGGRVTKPSVKNFQLVDALHDPEHDNIIMQHGRVSQDKFTVDVQHPMSLLQGFAIALSSLHQKKGVD